ncbi:NfeD family protein [Actinomyces israelii]|mgnify:FL=1|uniref:NfeD family protein n=1 Tax=Actinomyces israelii TaxID=1659 RepID=UPI0025572CF2|nr:NfeD family protein [Actinomyces israelii]WKR21961.1 hypothetical protein AIF0345_1894 [Actinomyces israelii]
MAWLWWLGASLVMGVVETLTVDLTFLMLAGGALGGAAAAALGGPLWVQALVFAVVSVLLLVAVRPWARRRLTRGSPDARTNAEGLIGREAVALTAVDAHGGRVRLGGEEWSARLSKENGGVSRLSVGDPVRVTDIDGAIAVVAPAGAPAGAQPA